MLPATVVLDEVVLSENPDDPPPRSCPRLSVCIPFSDSLSPSLLAFSEDEDLAPPPPGPPAAAAPDNRGCRYQSSVSDDSLLFRKPLS